MIKNFELPTMKTVDETAKLTGLSKYRIRMLVLQGDKIKYIRAGKKILVNVQSVAEYLNKGDNSQKGIEDVKIRKIN